MIKPLKMCQAAAFKKTLAMYSVSRTQSRACVVMCIAFVVCLGIAIASFYGNHITAKPHWQIESILQEGATLTVVDRTKRTTGTYSDDASTIVAVPESLRKAAAAYAPGDLVELRFAKDSKPITLERITTLTISPSGMQRRLFLIAGLLIVPITAGLFLWGGVLGFLLGKDNRYSNSKTQAALWFTVLIGVFVATVLVRGIGGGAAFVGGIEIPTNLLLLSGLSVLTFAGAKWITTARLEQARKNAANAKAAALAPAVQAQTMTAVAAAVEVEKAGEVAEIEEKRPARDPSGSDLVRDDQGDPDFADFQMLVVTGLAAVVYLIQIDRFLASMPFTTSLLLPDVDSTILAAFGLGQGAYLIKKAASDTA